MENGQAIYDTKYIAKFFQISTSTVRKYCDFLEKAGYTFHKNEYGHRGFFDDDIIVIRKLIDYKRNMTLEQATKSVVAWKNGNDIAHPTTSIKQYSTQHSDLLLKEFQSFQEQQMEFNKKMIERMEKTERHQAERDKNLMLAINQLLETKKELASTSKQKKWWEFWR